jgi:hypothetical protein
MRKPKPSAASPTCLEAREPGLNKEGLGSNHRHPRGIHAMKAIDKMLDQD